MTLGMHVWCNVFHILDIDMHGFPLLLYCSFTLLYIGIIYLVFPCDLIRLDIVLFTFLLLGKV